MTAGSTRSTGSTVPALASLLPRLGAPHFAHLRAVAEGVSITDAAARYLAVDHAAAALGAHRLVVDQVRAIARRRGDSRWRLIGMEISAGSADAAPSIDDWAAAQGLDDWSHAELQDLYAARFGPVDLSARRRQARNARLRERRLQLLRELEAVVAERARPTDLLEGWLPGRLAEPLARLGCLTLGELVQRIERGGRWWAGIPGYGPTKAERLARFAQALLPTAPARRSWPVVLGHAPDQPGLTAIAHPYSGAQGRNRAPVAYAGTDAENDQQAVLRWIAARATSEHTRRQYRREAERFVLWCILERHKALSDATAEDCRAYMDFIANVPPAWTSRRNAARHTPGWAPFKGPLTPASQGLALAALHSLFSWLVQARYLASNPWLLVNRKLGDDARQLDMDADGATRAFTPAAWSAIQVYLRDAPSTPANARNAWLCTFVESTGLRSAELLRAELGHLRELAAGWVIKIHGKGRKNRVVPVPRPAIKATIAYLASRGVSLATAPASTPLLGSLADPSQPIGYSALHQTFTRFVRKAVRSLPLVERQRAEQASMHWLRHTHATRAAERNVPPDVLQENLGQSDPRTTARYYRAQIERRQRAMEESFGGA